MDCGCNATVPDTFLNLNARNDESNPGVILTVDQVLALSQGRQDNVVAIQEQQQQAVRRTLSYLPGVMP